LKFLIPVKMLKGEFPRIEDLKEHDLEREYGNIE
jgi:hypothetical protein